MCAFRVELLWGVLLSVGFAGAVHRSYLYPHGRGVPDKILPPQDDISSPEIVLRTPIVFYDETYHSVFVNSNGILSFITELYSFFNIQFPLDYPVIAPLYTNVDVRASGAVYYRETQEPQILERATDTVRKAFSSAKDFETRSVLLVTWEDVGYHNQGADKVNTFQVAVISSDNDSYAEFLYPEDGIQWIKGTGSSSSLPDALAQAGFVSADGRVLLLKGSGTDQILHLNQWTNNGNPGQWLFHIGRIGPDGNVSPPDFHSDEEEEMPKTCSAGIFYCHSKAMCDDYESGFCCACKPGYYGNGISCLNEDVPVRVNGKLTGVVNGVNITDVVLQAYVVPKDGRSYTALSKVPMNVGYDMQSLNVLGSTVGWLFAKPVKGAPNGYQLTGGVFNQTVTITYPQTGHQLILRQKFTGLDVFEQLTMTTEIKGDIPNVPMGSKINIRDYDEQYTHIGPGQLLGHSSQVFQLEGVQIDNPFTVEQNIQYHECEHSAVPVPPFRLKVARNFIGYETENIIRYAMNNKVTPVGIDEDPCKENRDQCGRHSTCIAEGDTFRCICNPGYQYTILSETESVCMDADECATGTHNCHNDAVCLNNQGSFYCQCNAGYSGDGVTCIKDQTCDDLRCDYNAYCVQRIRNMPQCFCKEGFEGNGTYCTSTNHTQISSEYGPDYRPEHGSPDYSPEQRPDAGPDYRPSERWDYRPEYRPEDRPDYRPGERPEYKPEDRPDYRPEERPEYRPEDRQGYRPGERPEYKPEDRPDYRPGERPEYKPEDRPDYRPEERPEYRPEDRQGYRPEERPEYRPEERPEYRPEDRPEYRPDYRPEDRPESRPDYRPGYRPEDRTGYRPEDRPDYRPEDRPGYRPEDRPDYRPESRQDYRPEDRPGYRPEDRPDYRPESRQDYRPEGRQDYRPEDRPGYRPEDRPDYRPESRPGYRPEDRTGYRPDYRPDYRPTERPDYRPDGGRHFRPDYWEEQGRGYKPGSRHETEVAPRCVQNLCHCPEGFELDEAQRRCFRRDDKSFRHHDMDEIKAPQPEPVCYLPGKCSCPKPFKYNKVTNECDPQPSSNKSLEETKGPSGFKIPCDVLDRCHPHAQCVATSPAGNYRCECNPGYQGDGIECTPTSDHFPYEGDECLTALDCVGEADCIYDIQLRRNTCICFKGFFKDPISRTCVEERMADTRRGGSCAEHYDCHENAACAIRSSGTPECVCNPGYEGDGKHECRKVQVGCQVVFNCAQDTADCLFDAAHDEFRCRCKPGYEGDGYTCTPMTTCIEDPSICGENATCLPSHIGGYSCRCNQGFIGNGLVCKPEPEKIGNFLLLNQGNTMIKVPYNPTSQDPAKPIMMQYVQQSIGIDIDCTENRVYWSDIAGKKIESASYMGTDVKKFITEDIASVEGLAIDWLSRNIYWTDSKKDTVEVASLDNPKLRKVLISGNLVNPRGVAVHPSRGKLFWSDWNRAAPKIEWSNLDGSNRAIFAEGPSVQLPNSLAVDYVTDEVCWADAGTKSIECTGIANRYTRTVTKNCSYPFGLAISQDHYYWTDWTTRKVERISRRTQSLEKALSVPLVGSAKLYGIVAVPDSCPRISNICQHDYGRCPENHLCLPDGGGGRNCICGMETC